MERLGDGWDLCVVTDGDGIVQGLLGRAAIAAGGRASVEEAMMLGPSTIRPSARRDAVVQRMRDQGLTRMVVTHPDGVLVGVVRREDLD